jgi:hypothetical protein
MDDPSFRCAVAFVRCCCVSSMLAWTTRHVFISIFSLSSLRSQDTMILSPPIMHCPHYRQSQSSCRTPGKMPRVAVLDPLLGPCPTSPFFKRQPAAEPSSQLAVTHDHSLRVDWCAPPLLTPTSLPPLPAPARSAGTEKRCLNLLSPLGLVVRLAG